MPGQTLELARQALLGLRAPGGCWAGELSSSALSTATALFALSLHDRDGHRKLIDAGVAWILDHQNADGGWGDTVLSHSNISTTTLCWAALTVADDGPASPAVARAEGWLGMAAGSLAPNDVAAAIAARYGKDRTFSVPILTMAALAGRLSVAPTDDSQIPFSRDPKGSAARCPPTDRAAWRLIAQLPYELAAFPQSWFRFFKLPVVSYALPALIAMGLCRHVHRPSWNPFARLIRRLATTRTLRVLSTVQPVGGGFLEATPLTSFVVMSLIGAGQRDHGVVAAGVDFLVRSARADGSWPIDTNLATWVTTLSVNALAAGGLNAVADALTPDQRSAIRDWLLGQQYRVRHPYTGAPPGAWAWTDLPGGVPDGDDTAGALLALHHLGDVDARVTEAAAAGVRWLLDLQNGDGGIPTFCRGWTNLPFDRSGPDLTAHALHAWQAWHDRLPPALAARVTTATARAMRYLQHQQRRDGAWTPLWFGNQHVEAEENPTYGTAKVLIALCHHRDGVDAAQVNAMIDRGVAWLIAAQNLGGGWGGAAGTPSSIEETGLTLSALGWARRAGDASLDQVIERGAAWLGARTDGGRQFAPSPIGFYFAKLWYFERAYPVLFTVEGLGRIAGQC